MFGNELKEVPIESWGLDDLVVAREMRAAAGTHFAVRRNSYPGPPRPRRPARVRRSPQFHWGNATSGLGTGSLLSDTVRRVPQADP
jgi:hypothetical protein